MGEPTLLPCPNCEDGIVSPYCCGADDCIHAKDDGWTCRRCNGTGEIERDNTRKDPPHAD